MISREAGEACSPEALGRTSPLLVEDVTWLDCRGQPSSLLLETLGNLLRLRSSGTSRSSLFLFVLHLEEIEGSLSRMLLGLHSLLRAGRSPVIVVEPSGYAHLVWGRLEPHPNIRLIRHEALLRSPRRLMVVGRPGAPTRILEDALGALGQSCEIVPSASDAPGSLSTRHYDVVVLDLDLCEAQSVGLAEFVRERHPRTALLGITSREEAWNPERSHRSGIRRILSKPCSLLELLASISEMPSGSAT